MTRALLRRIPAALRAARAGERRRPLSRLPRPTASALLWPAAALLLTMLATTTPVPRVLELVTPPPKGTHARPATARPGPPARPSRRRDGGDLAKVRSALLALRAARGAVAGAPGTTMTAYDRAIGELAGMERSLAAEPEPVAETGETRPAAGLKRERAARRAVAYARAQLGKPYVYGGVGPRGFDCSGLVMKAYRAAGITLPRTSDVQYRRTRAHRVPRGSERPGDLVFFDYHRGMTGPGHVGIVIDPKRHLMIAAPHTGTVVKIQNYYTVGRADGFVGFTRPVGGRIGPLPEHARAPEAAPAGVAAPKAARAPRMGGPAARPVSRRTATPVRSAGAGRRPAGRSATVAGRAVTGHPGTGAPADGTAVIGRVRAGKVTAETVTRTGKGTFLPVSISAWPSAFARPAGTGAPGVSLRREAGSGTPYPALPAPGTGTSNAALAKPTGAGLSRAPFANRIGIPNARIERHDGTRARAATAGEARPDRTRRTAAPAGRAHASTLGGLPGAPVVSGTAPEKRVPSRAERGHGRTGDDANARDHRVRAETGHGPSADRAARHVTRRGGHGDGGTECGRRGDRT